VLRVRDLMTEDLVTVTPADTLREAAEAMAGDHVSGLPVVEGGRAVGVLSATDLLGHLADSPGVEVPRVGSWPVDRIPAGSQWEEGTEIPSRFFREDWEESRYAFEAFPTDPEGPEWNVLEETTVGELMTRDVLSLPSEAPVQDAAREMLDSGVRRLLVVDDGKLVGVISSTDIMEAVAEHGLDA